MKADLSNWQDSDLVLAAEKYEKENRRDSSFYHDVISELEIRYQKRTKEIVELMKK